MALVITITFIAVGALVAITLIKGFEAALPFFAFLVTVLPGEARFDFWGLFVLTTTRAAIATLAVLYIVLGNKHPNSDRSNRLPLKYLLILYIGWRMVATANSIVFTTSLKTVLSDTLEFCLVYYIIAKSLSKVETVRKILAAFVAALAVCCVFGALDYYAHWKVIDLFPTVVYRFTPGVGGRMPDSGRIKATFGHAILFGNALALGIPWALYLLGMAKTAAQKVYLWLAIIMMAWNMYKTQSRGPWLALVLSLLLLFIFSQGSLRKYLVVIALLTVSALIIRPGVWDALKSTYVDTGNPDSVRGGSYQYRYDLMRVAREALAEDPRRAVWGFGPESFYYVGLEGEDSTTGRIAKFESCDSSFVEVAVDTGYVGLFLLAALLIKVAFLSLKGFTTVPRPANFLCLLFLINIAAFAFMMFSVMNFGWGQQALMLWILMALSVVYPRLAEAENVAKRGAVIPLLETRPQWADVPPL
jgi:O-antigen ligase